MYKKSKNKLLYHFFNGLINIVLLGLAGFMLLGFVVACYHCHVDPRFILSLAR